MKNSFIILFSFLILYSCNESVSDSNVLIKSKNDTIEIDEIYKAELYVLHTDSSLPNFYVASNRDTFLLPFDERKKCAVYKAVGGKKGKMSYEGYVKYINQEGIERKQNFQIKYFVK
ncbi:unnamed protein product [marine sediment metagenome]|uniref:Lipoprotein n=1 Tax=marine sediment metagenome TaxID=412755 RepID=X1JMM8_9ZZZZ